MRCPPGSPTSSSRISPPALTSNSSACTRCWTPTCRPSTTCCGRPPCRQWCPGPRHSPEPDCKWCSVVLADARETLLDIQALQCQDAEDRYLTDGVSWQQYEALLARRGDRSGYRVSYLDGVLEIVAPSRRHESGKTRIGTLLEIFFLETDTVYFPLGSTTLRTPEKRGGAEPD